MSASFNVLFICTHNSARSIMAEAILNKSAAGRFMAYSAGSQPSGKVHPLAIELLQRNRMETSAQRSKSWEEFAAPGAPQMDFVLTVCDNAAGEVCPVWPGQPMTAHWGVEDPPAAQGTDEERAELSTDQGGPSKEAKMRAAISPAMALRIERRLEAQARTNASSARRGVAGTGLSV